MKKLYIIGLFLITILALGVSAADLTVSPTALSTEDTKPTASFSVSFTVKNASENLTGLNLAQSGLNDFNINFSVNNVPGNSFSLNTGEEKTIKVNGKIPDDINTRLSPFSGTITISGGGISSKTVSLDVNAESQLNLDNVKFVVDGKSKSIDDGDTRKDVIPGSKLEIKGDIENLFSDDDDITIEDVTIEITIESIDDEGDDDLEGDDDTGDIDADDKESFSVEFEIPEDVDDGDYDVVIIVEGEDENGAKHSVEWNDVRLSVEKDKHDIWITKASVSPSRVSCSRNINVNVELKNQGRSDEDEVVVIIESAALGIDREDTTIDEIEEGTGDDTELDLTYSFSIDDKVSAGTYSISVKAYYDTDTLSDTETVDLIVERCEVVEEEEEEEEETVVVVTPPEEEEEEEPEIITTPVTETTETSLLQSNTYLILLIGAVGIAVIVIIIMVLVLFSMKKKV